MVRSRSTASTSTRSSRPPVPREHGAWAMLYAPSLACVVGIGVPPMAFAVFLVCLTAVFFGQNAAGPVLRGRGGLVWFVAYAAAAIAAGALLVFGYGYTDLVWTGGLGTLLIGRQLATGLASGKRVDRSVLGEVLSVGGLALTGSAACVVATGRLDLLAACVWIAFWTKYVSGIYNVKMLVGATKARAAAGRWQVGRGLLIYHAVLLTAVVAASVALGWPVGGLVAMAYLPLFLRAFYGWWRLSGWAPKLKTIGLLELCYTLWFVIFASAALRFVGPGAHQPSIGF